jgi:hypothetical protein
MKLSIAHLRAAGVSDKQIVDAMAEAEAARREQNRKAQQNHRACQQKRADRADKQIIQQNQRSCQQKSADNPPLKNPPQTIQKPKKVSVSLHNTKLPFNWMPSDSDYDYACSKGWSNEKIAAEAERFRFHFGGNGKAMANWHLVWCKWVTNDYGSRNGGQNVHGRRHGSVLDACDRLEERFRSLGATGSYVPGSSGPRPLEELEECRKVKVDQGLCPGHLKLIPPR